MYVGVGYSTKSEMDAFHKAMKMVKEFGISIDSIALDKYYSSRKVLKLFGNEDPVKYLKNYFQRNLSEAAFSADKRRFGWIIRQKREERQEMAMFSIALLHNIFTVRVAP